MEIKRKGKKICLIKGDITEFEGEAIVNAANNRLLMGGGVAGAIKRKGGKEIEEEAVSKGPIPIGEAILTGAGRLKARYVIHAAVMGMDFKTDEDKIRSATLNSLKRAEEKGLKSIAFPALGTGVGRFPVKRAAEIMLKEAMEHLEGEVNLKEIYFYLFTEDNFKDFKTVLERLKEEREWN